MAQLRPIEEDEDGWNRIVRIGMFGLGTVGTGVAEYIQRLDIPERTGLQLVLEKVCVANPDKPRDIELAPGILTSNPADILDHPNIDVVVEVMMGEDDSGWGFRFSKSRSDRSANVFALLPINVFEVDERPALRGDGEQHRRPLLRRAGRMAALAC